MSARRKGKPQQRKQIETLEAQQDFLTCGHCQREFVLSDITKFIQHKVNRCNKDDRELFADNKFDADDNSDGVPSVISNRRLSISAPIARKTSMVDGGRDKLSSSPRPSLLTVAPTSPNGLPASKDDDVANDDSNGGVRRPLTFASDPKTQDDVERALLSLQSKQLHLVDASVNTIPTEPEELTCATCDSLFCSAWFLLQHVQHQHNNKIFEPIAGAPPPYIEREDSDGKDDDLDEDDEDDEDEEMDDKENEIEHMDEEESLSEPKEKELLHSNSPMLDASKTPPQQQKSPTTNSSPVSAGSDVFSHSPPFPVPRQPHSPAAFIGHAPFSRPPFSPEFSPITAEMIDPFRRMQPFGPLPPGLEHAIPGFPFRPPGFEGSAMDYYSQRLRLLANQPTSPSHSPSPAQKAPPGLSPQPPVSSFSHSPGSDGRQSALPVNLKMCEFCGKGFKFPSNLAVHRRSHTGEKPFKCLLCPHECIQASKLKRHMKIHAKTLLGSMPSSRLSNNSDHSGSGSVPNSPRDDEEEETEDEVEMDEEAVALREAAAEEDIRRMQEQMMQLERQHREMMQQQRDKGQSHDRRESVNSMNSMNSEPSSPNKRKAENELPLPPSIRKKENEQPTDLSLSKEQRAAILSEVLDHTGLGNIQQYKDAYSAAIAESTDKRDEECRELREPKVESPEVNDIKREITSNGLHESDPPHPSTPSTSSVSSNSSGRSSISSKSLPGPSHHIQNAYSPNSMCKKPKLEPQEQSIHPALAHGHPFLQEAMYGRADPRELYSSGIWVPPIGSPRDIFNAINAVNDHRMFTNPGHHPHPHHHRHHPLQENGIPGRESALNPSPKSGQNFNAMPASIISQQSHHHHHHHHAPHHHGIPGVPERRRNDTCEFCGKIFKNCSNLTVHRRSHTGEKPYKCELCSYACAQSSKLTRHMKTHGRLGKDVYRCKFCQMPFSVASTLEKHMRRCVENQQSRGLGSASLTSAVHSPASNA